MVGRLPTVVKMVEEAGCKEAIFVWDGLSPSAKCALVLLPSSVEGQRCMAWRYKFMEG